MIWKRDEEFSGDRIADDGRGSDEREGPGMTESGEVTVVGQGAKLEGTIVSAGSLRIDGQVRGQINADGDVLLTQQSHVEADIRAKSVSVAGRFRGNIAVSGKAELKRGGRVEGNITSKSLVIEEGGSFDGQSVMESKPAQQPPATAQHVSSKGPQAAGSGERSEVKVP